MSVGRKEAFETFRRDYSHNDTIEENKQNLKQRLLFATVSFRHSINCEEIGTSEGLWDLPSTQTIPQSFTSTSLLIVYGVGNSVSRIAVIAWCLICIGFVFPSDTRKLKDLANK